MGHGTFRGTDFDRRRRERALAGRYKPLPGALRSLCFYCGVPADSLDHVPPLLVVFELGVSYFEDASINLWIVPACRQCNGHLARNPPYTPYERRKEIAQWLRKRYEKLLQMPHWDNDDLELLGRGLKQQIRDWNQASDFIKRRIGFAERD